MLANDIRRPISPILRAVDALRVPETTPGNHSKALDTIERQTKELAGMAERLADLANLQTGQYELQLQNCNCVELLQHACERLGNSSSVDLISEGPIWVRADALRLEKAFKAILDHAGQNSDDAVAIQLRVQQREPGMIP